MSECKRARHRRARPSLHAAWKAATVIERRRFVAELLVELLPQIGPSHARTPSPPALLAAAPALDEFLSRCVVKSPGGRVQSAVLYEAYRQLALGRGEEPLTHKAVSAQLSRRGFAKRHSNLVWWLGISLVPTEAPVGGADVG